MPEDVQPEATPQSAAQKALASWVTKKYQGMSKGRSSEEREWFRAGMFYQQKQWLEKDPENQGRIRTVQASDKIPMPTTNHFSRIIDMNANALGAAVPSMYAKSENYDARNRRAAEAAENAIDAANEESGMNVICPTLAVQTVLWGVSVSKDTVAFDHSTDQVPDIQPGPPQLDPQTGQMVQGQPQVVGQERVPSPRLKTENPLPFEVYWTKDCIDPNLSSVIVERMRPSLGEAREMFPDFKDFQKDESDGENSNADYYVRTLRTLWAGKDDSEEKTTLLTCWLEWSALSEDVQEAIAEEFGEEPSAAYQQDKMLRIEAAVEYGLFCTTYKDTVLEWGENPFEGHKVYTFYLHKKDPASPTPAGMGRSIIPLQSKLNQLDSLMILAAMSNATVKLLWPTTQSTKPPTGSPIDVVQWDPLGDGKIAPTFFGGKAYGSELVQLRVQTLADLEALSGSNAAAQGEIPEGGTPFRALAFASSKSEESRKTSRFLWESSHERRARLLIAMARKIWSEPRKIETAGFNNRFGAQLIASADLEGDYSIEVIQDSSRPKTQTEKLQVVQLLLSAGMVSAQDPTVREYMTDTLGVQDINLVDHLQFVKAERDLDLVKQGQQPQDNPFSNWAIFFQTFSNFSLTEEYEALDSNLKQGLMLKTQWYQQMMMPPPQLGPTGPPAGPRPEQKGLAKAGPAGQSPSHVLSQVPGATVSAGQVQGAAQMEGDALVANLP